MTCQSYNKAVDKLPLPLVPSPMFTPDLEGFCPLPTSPLSAPPGFSPQLATCNPFPILRHTEHQTRHTRNAGNAATPFFSSACAQFPSHMGCACSARASAQFLPGFSTATLLCTHSIARNSNPFRYLLHSSLYTREGVSTTGKPLQFPFLRPGESRSACRLRTMPRQTQLLPGRTPFFLQLSTFDRSTLQVQSPHLTQGVR
jgi:hypothetical protein